MSLLSDLQERLRRNLGQIPGYAGGNLQDQLSRDAGPPPALPQDPNDQILTAANRDAITRPRQVGVPVSNNALASRMRRVVPEVPTEMTADPEASRQRAVSFDTQTGQPNRDFYQNNPDALESSKGYYDALQKWEPRGHKRGFKNTLKAGAMAAAEAVRANPDDPVTAALAGFGIGAAGGTISPNFTGRLRRNMEMQRAGGELQGQLKLAGEQAKIDALRARPQIQQATLDEREINNALTQYNRLESYDPDDPGDAGWKHYFESRGIQLPKKDRYRRPIATWANGQLILTDAQGTRAAEIDGQPVIDAARMPTEVTVGDRTFNVPQTQAEQSTRQTTTAAANRAAQDVRSRRSQKGQDRRLTERLNAPKATKETAPDRASARKAAQLVGLVEQMRRRIAQADEALSRDSKNSVALRQRADAQALGEGYAKQLNELNAGYEAGAGEKGYPYWKKVESPAPARSQTGRTIEGAIEAFKRKVKREPTSEEIANMQNALNQK